jgi:hypothetical protein
MRFLQKVKFGENSLTPRIAALQATKGPPINHEKYFLPAHRPSKSTVNNNMVAPQAYTHGMPDYYPKSEARAPKKQTAILIEENSHSSEQSNDIYYKVGNQVDRFS